MPKKKTIFVIEDDRDICRTLELHLKSIGYETVTSFDGKEGFERVKALKPDLLILDLGLPHLPGEEICRELRRNQEYQSLPIIMVTAKDTDVDRVIGRVIGADYYVSKPFDLDDLEEKIKALINKKITGVSPEQAVVKMIKTERIETLGREFIKGNIPEIENGLCDGCSLCVKRCRKLGLNVLEIKDKKAVVARSRECISCGACMIACPKKAISLLSHYNPLFPPKIST
ncbi:MAG: response regulator [Candidatus Omnitrophica bacterium]|nr:response regulator [Candidatus Omnitrophota bacterium]